MPYASVSDLSGLYSVTASALHQITNSTGSGSLSIPCYACTDSTGVSNAGGTLVQAFQAWTQAAYIASSTVANTVWTGWLSDDYPDERVQAIVAARAAQYAGVQARHPAYERRQLTAEERAAHLAAEADRERQRLAHVEAAAEARRKAEALLRGNLSAAQLRDLDSIGAFYVDSVQRDGTRRRYRIDRGRSGNIKEINAAGQVVRQLCAHPVALVPDADTMLAQKLMLEAAPEAILRIANVTEWIPHIPDERARVDAAALRHELRRAGGQAVVGVGGVVLGRTG